MTRPRGKRMGAAWALLVGSAFVVGMPGFDRVVTTAERVLGGVVGTADAAVGGGSNITTTFTTSTTNHATYTLVELPDIHVYETRVVAVLGGSVVVFDETVEDAPNSATVQEAENQASAALQAAGGGQVLGPSLSSSSQSSRTELSRLRLDHTEESVTTSVQIGPATIMIGDDQSETFFVPTGTTNINTNTHTENFFEQNQVTVVTHFATYTLAADPMAPGSAPPTPARGAPVAPASDPTTPDRGAPVAPAAVTVPAAPAAALPVGADPRFTG